MMQEKMRTFADMPLRPRLEGKYGHDTKLFKSIDDWVNGGANDYVDDPEGTVRLGVNLNDRITSHCRWQRRSGALRLQS